MNGIAIYPGSFDPVTYGHIDIVHRAMKVFPKLIVGISLNAGKFPLFDLDERLEMWKEILSDYGDRVEVETFTGLLIDYAREKKASAIIRGLRAVSDFEYEFQMAHMNKRLNPDVETFFMMTGSEHFYVSSRTVKEVASMGGNIEAWVPPSVAKRMREKYGR
jgi:pantetheine-phosphate adenylyltransferase